MKKFSPTRKELRQPVFTAKVPIKRIVDYYARSKDEAIRMRRVALSVLACVQWRGLEK